MLGCLRIKGGKSDADCGFAEEIITFLFSASAQGKLSVLYRDARGRVIEPFVITFPAWQTSFSSARTLFLILPAVAPR
jgi:hypothetical protein